LLTSQSEKFCSGKFVESRDIQIGISVGLISFKKLSFNQAIDSLFQISCLLSELTDEKDIQQIPWLGTSAVDTILLIIVDALVISSFSLCEQLQHQLEIE
jgi:hypothetical protein